MLALVLIMVGLNAFLLGADLPITKFWQAPPPGSLLVVDAGWNSQRVLLVTKARESESLVTIGEIEVGAEPDVVLSPDRQALAVAFAQLGQGRMIHILDPKSGKARFGVDHPNGMGWHMPAPFPLMAFSKDSSLLFVLRRVSTPPDHDQYFLATLDMAARSFRPKVVNLGECRGAVIMAGLSAHDVRILCMVRGTLQRFDINDDGAAGTEEKHIVKWPAKSRDSRYDHSSAVITDQQSGDVHLLRKDGAALISRPGQKTWSVTGALDTFPAGVWVGSHLATIDERGLAYVVTQRINFGDLYCPSFAIYNMAANSWDGIVPVDVPIADAIASRNGSRIYTSTENGVMVFDASTRRQLAFSSLGARISSIIPLP
jgi:hypothetical protein